MKSNPTSTFRFPLCARLRTAVGALAMTCLVGAILLFAGARAAFALLGVPQPDAQTFREDRLLVKPNPGADLTGVHNLVGAQVLQVYPAIGGLQVLQLPPDVTVADAIAVYQQSGLVEYAEPDFIVEAQATPNDFRYWDGSLWGLNNTGQLGGVPDADIDAPEGWDIQNTAPNVIIAVIDSGVRLTHEDLTGNLWVNPGESGPGFLGVDKSANGLDDDGNGFVDDVHGINAILRTGTPADDHGHGTHVSGILGGVGNNSVGVVGVAWRVQIMACKFLDSTAHGSISDAIACIDYARNKGANIINASWGGYDFTSAALRDAINSARTAGIIFVAATGNDGTDNDTKPLFPASYDLDNIVAVAATTRTDSRATWSNFGASTVDLGAPGLDVFSSWNGSDNSYQWLSGTSMAAPHVAGACAIVWARNPGETYRQIINRILSNTDPLPTLAGKTVTGGRLNLQKALGGVTAPTVVTAIATDSAASETGPDPGTFTISRSGGTSGSLTVNYTVGGTAANGTDYSFLSGVVTIPAGATSANVVVNPVDDTAVEGAESVILTLSPGAGYAAGAPNSATITLADNDAPTVTPPTVTVSAPRALASETNSKRGSFKVSRGGSKSGNLTVQFSLGGTAVNGSDYRSLPTSITIPSGAGSITMNVVPIDDRLAEGDETVVLTLQPNAAYQIGSPGSANVKITDNDSSAAALSSVTVAANDAAASESGPGPGEFTFTRTGSTAASLTVDYQLSGTATPWNDYRRPEGDMPVSLTIPAGASSAKLTIYPYDDLEIEGDETVVLTLAPDPAYTVGSPDSATVTIQDNDPLVAPPPVVLGGASGASILSNGGGRAPYQFQLTGAPNTTYAVQATTNFVDWTTIYTGQSASDGTLQFTDGATPLFQSRFYRARQVAALAGDFRQDRILVRPLPAVNILSVHILMRTRVLQEFPEIGGLQVLEVPAGQDVRATVQAYRQSGLVAYAEPDFIVHALAEPNDFRFQDGSLWSLNNVGQFGGTPDADIDAPEAWNVRTSAANAVVAVIDTGIRYTHEDLAANVWVNPGEIPNNGIDDDGNGFVDDAHGINAITGSGNPADDHGHGTHVSGIIGGAGNNTVGVAGVAWQAQMMACKFLDAQGSGSISDAITCLNYARAKGAKVINASWGTTAFNSAAFRDAIDSARAADIIFVAAAGNSAQDNHVNPIYPASFDLDNIISVAATTRTDGLASFSNYGATNVDLAAPGSPIFSCWGSADDAYQYQDGTSMAAAHVSGASALCRAQFPNETYQQIINRILAGTDPQPSLAGKCVTGGRLNLARALGSAAPPPPSKPTVTVVATDAAAAESGPNTGTFTISRSGSTSAALTVNYTLGGTAVNGADYQSPGTSVVIAAGATSAAVTVTPNDDSATESSETVVLTLSANAAYDIGSPGSATVTITDNDGVQQNQPVVTLEELDPNASETGPDAGVIRFHRTGDISQPLDVSWTFSGTAVNGSDYQQLPTTGTIPAGQAAADLTITPIDDSAVEGNETVVVTVVAGSGYSAGTPGTATVTIADNDSGPPPPPIVTITASDPNAGESGPDTGAFTISRAGDTSVALTVNYTVGGTATSGADYQSLGTSATIPAGAGSTTVTVTPVDDTTVESDETVVLTLATGTGYTVGSPNSATVTIADNDSAPPPDQPVVTLSELDPNASETGPDAGVIRFHRTGDISQPLTVSWTFSGTAVNGSDYQQLPTTGAIPAGQADADLTITPTDDSAAEGNETVIVTVVAGPGYTTGSPSTATVTIADNDSGPPPPPTVTITASDPNAGESGPDTGAFTISRTGDTSATLTVNYTVGGTATSGADYQSLGTSATIPAGAGSATVTVTPIDDSAVEGSETVVLTLATNAAYTIGSPDSATVTIADNDSTPPPTPTVTVTATDANAAESGPNTGTFTISRTGSTSATLTVSYTVGGTATSGADYQSLGTSATIPAGAGSTTVTVTPIDDTTVEGSETVVLTLATSTAYTIGSPNSATVTIADNDSTPPPAATVTVVATQPLATFLAPGVFTITRTGATGSSLTVNYSLGGSARNGVDYQALSGTAVISAGSASTTVLVRPLTSLSLLRTVVLTLSPNANYNVGSPGSATVTIPASIALGGRPTVTAAATVTNASESGGLGVFTVTRTGGDTSLDLAVRYTLGGHAVNGVDYQTLSGTVTILAGAVGAEVIVRPIDDQDVEIDEPVYLMLFGWTDAPYIVGSPDGAALVIVDNDQQPIRPTVTVAASDPNAAESGDTGTFTIRRTGNTSAALTVIYNLGGHARNGADYQTLGGSVTIPAGAASADVIVRPLDDTDVEIDEPAYLMLYGWTDAPYVVGSPDGAAVIIADND